MLITIISVICLLVFGYLEFKVDRVWEINPLTMIGCAVSATAVLICILLCIFTGYSVNDTQEKMENDYATLVAKIDDGYYTDNALLTYDLVGDVKEYNATVISMQRTINSPWTNWFGRSWMRDLKTIDFPKT